MNTPNKGLSKHLIETIKSLSKAEKKRFSLFLKKNEDKEALQFYKLYKHIDRKQTFDGIKFLKENPQVKPSQLSNLKRRLFSKLLEVLRQKEIDFDIEIQIRENIDAAQTLFNKGLYEQSLWLLNKAKQKAIKENRNLLQLEILDLEKNIELHFVTGRPTSIAIELTNESNQQLKTVEHLNKISGIALTFYGLYQERGYVKSQADFEIIKEQFITETQGIEYKGLNLPQKVYYHQAQFWYNYIIQNFVLCYKHALLWVKILEETNHQFSFKVQYFKGLNSLLNSLYRLNDHKRFKAEKQKLENLIGNNNLNTNLKIMLKKYLITHKLNQHVMEGNFEDGVHEIDRVINEIEEMRNFLEPRYVNNMYYKTASIYFGAGNYKRALVFLNKILFEQHTNLREDINAFSRILATVCYFELKDDKQLAYSIRSTYRFIGNIKDLNKFQKEIFRFLKKTINLDRYQTKKAFEQLYENMIEISKQPFEQRPFYYFDIISWLESKFENRPVAEIIREKGLGHRKLFKV